MGYYVNPCGETKERFLERVGTVAEVAPRWQDVPAESIPVVLIDNGWMTAAGICYCEDEFKVFTSPNDPRPRKIYIVPIAALSGATDVEVEEIIRR